MHPAPQPLPNNANRQRNLIGPFYTPPTFFLYLMLGMSSRPKPPSKRAARTCLINNVQSSDLVLACGILQICSLPQIVPAVQKILTLRGVVLHMTCGTAMGETEVLVETGSCRSHVP